MYSAIPLRTFTVDNNNRIKAIQIHIVFGVLSRKIINFIFNEFYFFSIKVITKLPNSEQSYKGKVQTHNYINRQNQSTTGKL